MSPTITPGSWSENFTGDHEFTTASNEFLIGREGGDTPRYRSGKCADNGQQLTLLDEQWSEAVPVGTAYTAPTGRALTGVRVSGSDAFYQTRKSVDAWGESSQIGRAGWSSEQPEKDEFTAPANRILTGVHRLNDGTVRYQSGHIF
ncbi:hypothetical protein [Streptomyces subrutilus]|uniref:Uncharacterized protein n=1 Tax=Streptomyces subrutilus TaxID=36818 RepID=A0A1E5PL26_9ACTN|nr:hypothetical protein [Streptomyces subrutilus]OEJ30052.1 hypothetical protein BGK67_00425 [Streptomyces subrutilus]